MDRTEQSEPAVRALKERGRSADGSDVAYLSERKRGLASVGAAGLLVLSLSLSACGSDAEADPNDDESAEDSATGDETDGSNDSGDSETSEEASPTPVEGSSEGPAQNWPEPEIPDEIYEPTEEGAEAAIRYWLEARVYARNTGDTGPLLDISSQDCPLCAQQAERVDEVYGGNGWFVQEPDSITEIFVKLEGDTGASGIFALDLGGYETYWEDRFYSTTDPIPETPWSAIIDYQENKWIINDISTMEIVDEEQ